MLLYVYGLQFSPVIPLLVGIASYRSLALPTRLFFWQLLFSLLVVSGMTIAAFSHMTNTWLMNLSLPVDVALILWMFSLWQKNRIARMLTRGAIALFIVIWLVEMIYGQRLHSLTIVARPLEGILIVIAACYAIYRANHDLEAPILELPEFWVASGILVYFGGMMILNLLSNSLLALSSETFKQAFLIQPALTLIADLIFIGAFRCNYQKRKSSGLSSSVQPSY